MSKTILSNYLPSHAVYRCFNLIKENEIHLKIVNKRHSKYGDFCILPDGKHQITINANENKYQFLITLVHEVAHSLAYKRFGKTIKPHGIVWKKTFTELMSPFISSEIFPPSLLSLIINHFKNPKASSGTDVKLAFALKQFDSKKDENLDFLFTLSENTIFKIYNGRTFIKGKQLIKRFKCQDIQTKKWYYFNPNTQVEIIQ